MSPQGPYQHGQQQTPYGYGHPRPPRTDLTRPIAIGVCVFFALFLLFGELAHHEAEHPQGHTSVVVGPVQSLGPGVSFHKVDLPGGDGTRTLWVYLPSAPATPKVPCVFIAPAGSTCLDGMALGEGDRPEHLPYVQSGYAVVAYSLDGAFTDRTSAAAEVHAIESFRDAHAGLDNEKAAVNYAIANIPQIDTSRLYAAGHSSAGTMALLAAENDRRIVGCIAYAPRCDVGAQLHKGEREGLTARIDGFDQFLATCSPMTKAGSIHCPVFLFHSDDDSRVPTDDVEGFLGRLRGSDPSVTYCHVPKGGHYNSMISVGIPQAINWLQGGMTTTADLPISSTTGSSELNNDPPASFGQ